MGHEICDRPGAEEDEVAWRYSTNSVSRKGSISLSARVGGSSGWERRRLGTGGTKKRALRAATMGS